MPSSDYEIRGEQLPLRAVTVAALGSPNRVASFDVGNLERILAEPHESVAAALARAVPRATDGTDGDATHHRAWLVAGSLPVVGNR